MSEFKGFLTTPPQRAGIKSLRAAGGEWRAEQIGFAYYRYHGAVGGHAFEVQSYAHSIMGINDCDDYESRWHMWIDGKEVPCFGWGDVITAVKEGWNE